MKKKGEVLRCVGFLLKIYDERRDAAFFKFMFELYFAVKNDCVDRIMWKLK